jgi:hypothetical protein
MIAAAVEEITADVLRALAGGERVDPAALLLLVRQYGASGRDDIAAALAPALGRALVESAPTDPGGLLVLCAEAARVSDDERLPDVALQLAGAIRRAWGGRQPIGEAMAGVDACLQAGALATVRPALPAAIDELERLIGRDYEPGEGLGAAGAADQLAAAAALLTAYEVTGRLPYAMLADELTQFVRRTWWRPDAGVFDGPDPFACTCLAARVCCRLAALHADADYRATAVVAPDTDYAADTKLVLTVQADAARRRGAAGAAYALAVGEWLALGNELQ